MKEGTWRVREWGMGIVMGIGRDREMERELGQ